jgi:peptide/nickel transport system permease protein
LLDVSLGNIATGQEKSYSAPFAIVGLWQETKQSDDGKVLRAPVRLLHGGAHLANATDVLVDVAKKSLIWLMMGAFIAGISVLFLSQLTLFRTPDIPWRTAAITFVILFALLAWLWGMGQSYHVLGTGKVGQDVLYESFKGVRTGVLIGGLTTLLTLPFAIVLGIAAGYFKGWVDDAVQYAYTTLNAVPGVLLIASAMLLAQLYLAQYAELFASEQERADVRLLLVCLVLGLTGWTGLARILRAESLKLREMEFVKAAKAFGVSHSRIIGRHLLPNVGHLILIAVVLDFSGLVLAEAVLSYVGIGVDPTMPSWGNMINLARQELNREPVVWWNLLGAFVGMFTLVLSANLLADRIQHVFNPRA